MASTVVRSRIFSIISRNNKPNRRFFCSNKERIISSQSTIPDQSAAAAAAAAEEAPAQASGIRENKAWKFFKYGIIGALTGATAFAGYASYAYSLDEVEEKTKTLRESVNYTASSDASNVEKYQGLLYSTVMTVPAKVVELYLDLRKLLEEHVKGFTEPASDKLLPDLHPAEQHVFTLVLDLNETIIYSDWKSFDISVLVSKLRWDIPYAILVSRDRGWRTFKRPGVDDFLQHLGRFYEIVVYSDQLSMYVDPVVERLDTNHFIRYRLSRSATKYQDGKHYRDLSKLNRDPGKILYVSGHAFENSLQPENCVPIKPFKIDETGDVPLDTALLDLIPFLEYVARNSPSDIRTVLASYERKDIGKEFLERSKDYQRYFALLSANARTKAARPPLASLRARG
ncbi:mitochondrial import inner membrane translocase subunit TIM50-like isoform X2 [Populus alba x Populus x berolinensis]|nr:mitochondrial import inner membrane translocase subunit TIM50-like isoform X2 [Populus alba x Populus x berolinensis]